MNDDKDIIPLLNLPFEVIEEDIIIPPSEMAKEETEQIPLPPKKEETKKRSKVAEFFLTFIMCIFGAVFLACIAFIGFNLWNKYEGGKLYEDMAGNFSAFDPQSETKNQLYTHLEAVRSDAPMQSLGNRLTSGVTDAQTPDTPDMTDRLTAIRESLGTLKEQNPDIYGWIYVEGTDINYPVLRGTDNSYYLDHSYEKKYLAIGSIFADYQSQDKITDNRNTVFYGHNVVTPVPGSSMFHDVEKFLEKDFFDSQLIYVYTLDGIYTFKPFSISPTVSDYQYFKVNFESEVEFAKFISEYKKNSRLSSDMIIDSDDKLLTLSTCTNGPQNARYALHAVLVEAVEDSRETSPQETAKAE